ncbi:hypothetical protein [Verrucosispora sp. WMMC514]|uniref:hypothetical protein n=1 Tax=Verrucosispora sp. WMMC514 TaxID=3015156 RepID=UPI00248CD4D8|nr:hypothetical protein [Verrucosispora sp. WMMC514]WBB94146.1 hypothetical protein O7597_14955 [Verrucosispora sp. WMMC514]
MILGSSSGYWSTGIVIRWYAALGSGSRRGPAWAGRVDFYDDGWAGDDDADAGKVSTEGRLNTRYYVRDGDTTTGLRAVIAALIADAGRLGITFGGPSVKPHLYYEGDGGSTEFPPPDGWRDLLASEAQRIGWEFPYASTEASRG